MSKYIKLDDALDDSMCQDIKCDYCTLAGLEDSCKVWTYLANLPTIEISDKVDRPYEHFEGYEDGKADRPQGEWIDTDMTAYGAKIYKCSNCHTVFGEINPARYHYCPHCGAEMKGEKK